MSSRRRRKVEHTDDWQELLPLFDWLEQEAYEELRDRWFCSATPWPGGPQRPELPSARCTVG
jgi:hypothetical protein